MSLRLLSFKIFSPGLMKITRGDISAFPTCFCVCLYLYNFYNYWHLGYRLHSKCFPKWWHSEVRRFKFSPVKHICIVYIISLEDGHIRAACGENCCIFVHSGSIFKQFPYQSCCSLFEIKIKLWKQTLEQQLIPYSRICLLLSVSDIFNLAL